MRNRSFQPGITTLVGPRRSWLAKKRIGLLSHPAAVDSDGTSSASLLKRVPGTSLVALFGPEHGFWGAAAAGKQITHQKHPCWHMPVYSLYGKYRKPTAAMLRRLDVIVVDLQDLGVRPYTYVSTLRFVLDAAAARGKTVIVADRPVPLPSTIDGPLLDPRYESFVAAIPAPMVYGMTCGETALWLKKSLNLDVDLKVSKMRNYTPRPPRQPDWPPRIPPSPRILSWECAYCYTATVFCEALPAIDNGRGTGLPFQLFGASWIRSQPVCEYLSDLHLPGVIFHSHPYMARSRTGGSVSLTAFGWSLPIRISSGRY